MTTDGGSAEGKKRHHTNHGYKKCGGGGLGTGGGLVKKGRGGVKEVGQEGQGYG